MMGIITDLRPQRRNPDRVSVYLDGQFAFGLAQSVAAGLKVGQALTQSEEAELRGDDEVEAARLKAFRFLSYRPRSRHEVATYLTGKSYSDEVIEIVLDYLARNQWLDDAAFARYWVEQREAFKPRSKRVLSQELRQKGLSAADIELALAEVDETVSARKAAAQRIERWSGLPENEFFQKMSGYLQRRGFSYDVVRGVAEELWQRLVAAKAAEDNPAN